MVIVIAGGGGSKAPVVKRRVVYCITFSRLKVEALAELYTVAPQSSLEPKNSYSTRRCGVECFGQHST